MSDQDKPARGRPRTMQSEKVLDVAVAAYQRTDPADVSVNAICQMAEISKPSLYRVFGNEDGLTRAALDRYADKVLSDLFVILQRGAPFDATIAALIDFAVEDPRLETGCLFYKMRAGKHRLGPKTRARIDEIDAAAVAAFAAYLDGQRQTGGWESDQPTEVAALYLREQIGLALTQRATIQDASAIRASLTLALSVLRR